MKKIIKQHLFDLVIMIENLKVKSGENGQFDIVQKIYEIISKIEEESD